VARHVLFEREEPAIRGIPRAEVVLLGPGGPRGTTARFAQVLLDTGAAHSQLPQEVALNVGIDPSEGIEADIATANGIARRWFRVADIAVQGIPLPQSGVYFAPGAQPLVGRSALWLMSRTVGFTDADWLLEEGLPREHEMDEAPEWTHIQDLADFFEDE
jgi:hypothetical protein